MKAIKILFLIWGIFVYEIPLSIYTLKECGGHRSVGKEKEKTSVFC